MLLIEKETEELDWSQDKKKKKTYWDGSPKDFHGLYNNENSTLQRKWIRDMSVDALLLFVLVELEWVKWHIRTTSTHLLGPVT